LRALLGITRGSARQSPVRKVIGDCELLGNAVMREALDALLNWAAYGPSTRSFPRCPIRRQRLHALIAAKADARPVELKRVHQIEQAKIPSIDDSLICRHNGSMSLRGKKMSERDDSTSGIGDMDAHVGLGHIVGGIIAFVLLLYLAYLTS